MLVNGVMLLPLPMYSPSLNPAWLLFNHIKYYTRGKTRSRNVDDLIDNVANVLRNNVDAKDIDFAFEEVENQYAKY
jgi:transposase